MLVVDDDARLREFMRVNLEMEGYSVREASSAEEALAVIEDQVPELVLLDVVHAGGRRLADAAANAGASRVDPGDHVHRPGGPEAAADAESRGARGFVGKPFNRSSGSNARSNSFLPDRGGPGQLQLFGCSQEPAQDHAEAARSG